MFCHANTIVGYPQSLGSNHQIDLVIANFLHYTVLHMFAQFGLFMKQNAYVPEGGNEEGSRATPTKGQIKSE